MKKAFNTLPILILPLVIIALTSCVDVVSKSKGALNGWPPDDVRDKFGVIDLLQPAGAKSIIYSETDDALVISFKGNIDSENEIFAYFGNWQNEGASEAEGEFRYSRDIAWVVFTAREKPYYEIAVYI